jgi:hypothetical protein
MAKAIFNEDIDIIGEVTLPTLSNSIGDYLTVTALGAIKFRTAEEVASEIGSLLGSDKTYVHDQTTPSATWTITHGLSKNPAIMVVDSAKTVVIGQVDYIDNNNVVITFNGAFSGYAYFN